MNPTAVPRVISRDPTSLPIGAIEGFVLSRIDGATTVTDIASVTGLPSEQVAIILARLADLAAIELPGYAPRSASSSSSLSSSSWSSSLSSSSSSGVPSARGVRIDSPSPGGSGSLPAVSSVPATPIDTSHIPDDHPDLREANDLDLGLRKEILALHLDLETRDHYTLLGVARSADRKQIKAAYYGLASKFHTDRQFGKNLGSFKAKMEHVFGRLTLAHEALSAPLRREEYDQYLATQEQTLAYERLLDDYDGEAEPIEEVPVADAAVRRVGSESRMMATPQPEPLPRSEAPHARPSPSAPASPSPSPSSSPFPSATPGPRASSSSSTMAAVSTAGQERIRREALARRLAGSSRRMPATPQPSIAPSVIPASRAPMPSPTPKPSTSAPMPTSVVPKASSVVPSARPRPLATQPPLPSSGPFGAPPSAPPGARSGLPPSPQPEETRKLSGFMRRPGDDRMQEARRAHVKKLVDSARESAAKGDYLGAANSYRLALQQVDDPVLQAAADEASKKAKSMMVEVYLKQARYEESAKKWGMAALSYLKALDGRPGDADLSERAANALRQEGRDLHRAARLAEAAVAHNPKRALFRATLGHIYLDAGLFLRARSELDNAVRLAPDDAILRELLTRARKAAS